MCFNPIKALPYAVGGLVGGTLIKNAMKGSKSSSSTTAPAPMVTQGTVNNSPYGG